MSGPRLLYLAAGGLGAIGLGLRLMPPGTPARAVPIAPPPAVSVPALPDTAANPTGTIVAANVFSARRAPPATRFLPDWAKRDAVAAARQTRSGEAPIRLYGITRGAGGAVALIDADPRVPGAEVYQVGDVVRGATILSVTDSTVVLGRASGPSVLRLPARDGER